MEEPIEALERKRGLADGAPGAVPRGADHANAKLSEKKVREIRELHARGHGYRRLGSAYGISPAHVMRIVKRLSWAHVE